ncbi:MAG TPA: universal stress protein [Salinimicrobium sp.]|nr:universal stress protein [Salinimicrobium sp.]
MNILLPTDFSQNSRNAAAYAMQFFKDIPCNFHFLHVFPVSAGSLSSVIRSIPSEIQEQFDLLLKELNYNKVNPGHNFHISFKVNYLIEAVREEVISKNIDLILMGTKGATNRENSVIGKNTSDVMMKVKCPVLAISEKAVYKGHHEILFPTDYKIRYGGKMLSTLFNLISLSQASVKILEIYNSEKEPSEDQTMNSIYLKNAFSPNLPKHQAFYRSENQNANSIFNANEKIDMIVLAAKNLNICHKLLNNQQNSNIPFINELPLLVLH